MFHQVKINLISFQVIFVREGANSQNFVLSKKCATFFRNATKYSLTLSPAHGSTFIQMQTNKQ